MASEKEVKIGITTTADTGGAEAAVVAIDEVIDKSEKLEDALEPKPGGGLEAIPAEARPAVVALDEVVDKAEELDEALEPKSGGGLEAIPADARPAVVALDAVVDKAEALDEALDAVDGKGLGRIPAEAAPAVGSIRQLEEEVEKLQSALARLPVGSTEFVTMAGKVNAAQKTLAAAHEEAKRFGATVGRKGNAGMAVLEFSRAFEDAQYGMRGVLNNIPGLVAQLGGGAGLAGAISIAAVAATQLWERLGGGTKQAKEEATDYLEIYKKLAAEFGNASLQAEEARGASMAANLAKAKEYAAVRQRSAEAELGLEKQRITGDGGVDVARARLELTRIETRLLTEGGEKALKLAMEREAALRRISELEKQNAERLRQADEVAAAGKVAAARETKDGTDRTKAWAGERSAEKRADLADLEKQLAAAAMARLELERELYKDRERARAELDGGVNPMRAMELRGYMAEIEAAMAKTQTPGEAESMLMVRRDEAEAAAKEAATNFKKASDDQLAAAAALKAAVENEANLKTRHEQTRKNEGELETINRAGEADRKVETGKTNTVEELNKLVEGIGESGGKDLAPFISEMKAILEDKALSADEVERVPVLMSQYFRQIANLGAAQNAAFKDAMGQVDELIRDVAKLKLAAKP